LTVAVFVLWWGSASRAVRGFTSERSDGKV
jgi:hypothetical protein